MALGVLQQGACAGGAETVGFKVGALAVAAGVFKGLGGVQVLEAQIAAGRCNGLVELVNAGLGLGSVRAVLGNGRNAHRDDVAVGVGRADALQELLVVGNEGVHTDRAVHIVRAQHHKDAAGLHLGDGLRDRVAAGVRCKVYTGGGQRLGNLQSLLPDKLIQRDAGILLQRHGVLVTRKNTGRNVGIIRRALRQDGIQRRIQRVGVRVVGILSACKQAQLRRQHPCRQNAHHNGQRAQRQHHTRFALCRAQAFFLLITFSAHRERQPP